MPLDNNKPRRRRKRPQAQGTGGDQPRGEQRNINTASGDYAEGNIDKRQGTFLDVHLGPSSARRQRLRFAIEALPEQYVPRPNELDALITPLLDPQSTIPVAITAALRGAGGYGKTTLARAICHDPRVRAAFDDQLLWVTLGEQPGDLTARINDTIERLTGQRPGFSNLEDATARLAELLDNDVPLLLIIDDVWNAAHLKPFLRGGTRCARLITTRNSDTLPHNARKVVVDAMQQNEALALLGMGLPPGEDVALRQLAARLDEWPLLLTLVNSALRQRVKTIGQSLQDALNYVNRAFDKRGLVAFDARNTTERSLAVTQTLTVSLELLHEDERTRYAELAIFPEDSDIPLSIVAMLWGATGGLDDFETEELCERLACLSLLLRFDPTRRIIRLHDVFRAYLTQTHAHQLLVWHVRLVNATALNVQAPVYFDELYLWRAVATHLSQAGQLDDLRTLLTNGTYLQGKIKQLGTAALLNDFALLPDDSTLQTMARAMRLSHILDQAPHELTNQLHGRLGEQRALHTLPVVDGPSLQLLSPSLTSPSGPLLRTFASHTFWVRTCCFSPDGLTALSASDDGTLRLWDLSSGQTLHILKDHTSWVRTCCFSPDGLTALSASSDGTLRLWDLNSSQSHYILKGHTDTTTACCFNPDGTTALNASNDGTLHLWDLNGGQTLLILEGHTDWVTACCFSSDGRAALSASDDGTLRLWDLNSGQTLLILEGHTSWVRACCFSPDGRAALSASDDGTLRLWSLNSGQTLLILEGHISWVRACCFSPDGRAALSASWDHTLRLWDLTSSRELYCWYADAPLTCCALHPTSLRVIAGDLRGAVHFLRLHLPNAELRTANAEHHP